MTQPLEIVLVSGLSGSGKSVTLHALEDSGFFCVDNLPVALVSELIERCEEHDAIARVAVAIDVRGRWFSREDDGGEAALCALLDRVLLRNTKNSIVLLACDDEVLINRFKASRRPHPLVGQGSAETLGEAIALERAWLKPFRQRATWTVDTSHLTVHDLRRRVMTRYGVDASEGVALHLVSFGFRHGIPPEADLVVDARMLENPYFIAELRDKTGRESEVARFVLEQALAGKLLDHVEGLLRDIAPAVTREGRAVLTVAVGCTGGHHRSVALIEALGQRLAGWVPHPHVIHRDIAR